MTKITTPAIFSLKSFFLNPRIYIVFLLIIMYLDMTISPIRNFCEINEVKTSIWLWSFIVSDYYGLLMIMLGAIFLLCDAPFITKSQLYIVSRTGRKNFIISQFIYIFMISAIYLIFTILTMLILISPCISFGTGWDKVINTFANNPYFAYDYNIFLSFPYRIIKEYNAISAFLNSFFLSWLVISFLGSVIFYLNLLTQKAIGTIVATILAVLEIMALNSAYFITYFSPVSWASISILDVNGLSEYPSKTYAITVLSVVIIILMLASIKLFKKINIEVNNLI